MNFVSPSKGRLSLEEVFNDIMAFMEEIPGDCYKIIIGTDSHVKNDTCFVTAIIVHRVGRGARYYYRKKRQRKIESLRQKIFYETALSLDTAGKVAEHLAKSGHGDMDLEIHLDIGPHGDTKELIREVVGMVIGSGFDAKIKPNSSGASTVADKYTK
ncbi:ribonuclease H-like YkuK family protein [Metallumcola ferriviriculae]|uniref:Ribonuclease H-like YkuK family protein n=1 Tax=Metallumcola ferriviriculae TaxID=3039180 RepID=A0AAU0UK30_9FIRM|nr:ribonuclease H-like YkuK family protein [Desulfitibacteraceae bacterium MK1]